jgi:D-threo-aldose 1-dehydrogenase
MKRRKFKTKLGAVLDFTILGFGGAPLGNLFRPISERSAQDTLDRAWRAGIRYFDTAPLYGFGLSETRLNHFLRGKKRDDYILSTKVGRRLTACAPAERTGIGKFFETPSRRETYDYGYDGVMRSFEDSLERLGVDRIDILFVHDIDVANHGSEAARDAKVTEFMAGGYRALTRLRDEKVVKAIGAGVNEWQVCEMLTNRGAFDIFLLAGRYTLLEQEAMNSFLPLCEKNKIGIIIGGPYNSGVLARGPKKGATYDYDKAPNKILDRVKQLDGVCRAHGVKLPEAALQFPLYHPQVLSVIPGAAALKEMNANIEFLKRKIPGALWQDLKSRGLLHPQAPTP